jgi:DNA-binding NarL/FixJ family response regulator
MSGPLQVIAVSFELGADFERRVLTEVDRLQGRGVLRLLDLLVVAKDDDGTLERVAIGDDDDFGNLLAGLLPIDGGRFARSADSGDATGRAPGAVWALAESLLPGTAIAFLLVQHGWAQPMLDAITETGGALLGDGFLTADAGAFVEAQIAAIDEAAEVIAAAQRAEARATLRALAADARAAEALEAEATIRAAAAAQAVGALITAGLIEEAATDEAIETLRTSGLLIAAADEAAAEAVREGAATVSAASITLAQARVLHYLPTDVTFAVIADKLGISRAAAKERAERLYKKLGVHSRADAVSRARELGLMT